MGVTSRTLLVLADDRGRIASVAGLLRDRLRRHGHAVEVILASGDLAAADHDVVVIGAEHGHRMHRRSIARHVGRNRAALDRLPTALFLVAGAAPAPAGQVLGAFECAVAWRPTVTGTLVYRRRDRHVRKLAVDVLRSLLGARESNVLDEVDELVAAVLRAARYRRDRTRPRAVARHDEPRLPARSA